MMEQSVGFAVRKGLDPSEKFGISGAVKTAPYKPAK